MAFGKLSARFLAWVQDGFLMLDDKAEECQSMSITNDAEEVVKWAVRNIKGWNRILYRDTMGQWDELVVKNNEFAGFRHIGGETAGEAIKNAQKKQEQKQGT